MKSTLQNWIKVGGHYINLDQVAEIVTNEERINWDEKGEPKQPCVYFVIPVEESGEYGGSARKIVFFGKDRADILAWLDSGELPYLPIASVANLQRISK